MIRLVVDASVAVKWVLKEPDSDAARRIAEQAELLAPDLLWAELGSLLWRRQRQGELRAFLDWTEHSRRGRGSGHIRRG
jgi:predicted nucleic acid-binding protein